MKWYMPSWSGDFRLEEIDESRTRLTIIAPTDHEKTVLRRFVKKTKSLVDDAALVDLSSDAKQEITFKASISSLGAILMPLTQPEEKTMTVVKFGDGSIDVSTSSAAKAAELIDADNPGYRESAKKKKPKAAVTTKRPTPCCPRCTPEPNVRASEVLDEFLTPEQRGQWEQERCILVRGNLTDHVYLVCHRGTARAERFGRICVDLTDEAVLHFHDRSVPAEEEVLATKHVLEHREHWLRNEATCLSPRFRDVYKNPFGDGSDGTRDAATTEFISSIIVGAIGGAHVPPR